MLKTVRGRKLTSREVALALGVSEATIKRWADSGLLPMVKTVGGHRRFRPEDVAVFKHSKLDADKPAALRRRHKAKPEKDAASANSLNIDETETFNDEMLHALLDGRVNELSSLLANLHLRGLTIAGIADDFLCVAMRRVGDLWLKGELSVAQEHVATRTATYALQNLESVMKASEDVNSLALCGSVEEDFHELPVQIAALALEEAGLEVFNLGTNTPFSALTEAIEKFEPRVVCVSSTILLRLDRAIREYKEFHDAAQHARAYIVLGGAGFSSGEVRKRLPADLHAENFRQLNEFLETMDAAEFEDSNAEEEDNVEKDGE